MGHSRDRTHSALSAARRAKHCMHPQPGRSARRPGRTATRGTPRLMGPKAPRSAAGPYAYMQTSHTFAPSAGCDGTQIEPVPRSGRYASVRDTDSVGGNGVSEQDDVRQEAIRHLRDTMNDDSVRKSDRIKAAAEILRLEPTRAAAGALDLHAMSDEELLELARGGTQIEPVPARATPTPAAADAPTVAGPLVPRGTSDSPFVQRRPKKEIPISGPTPNRIAPTAKSGQTSAPWDTTNLPPELQ